MLLKDWVRGDYRKMIGVGQITMILAMIILVTDYWLHTHPGITGIPLSVDFWEGFCMGLGITLALVSIILNVRGMLGMKQYKTN